MISCMKKSPRFSAFCDLLRGSDEQIKTKMILYSAGDLRRLLVITQWRAHDYQQIDVAFRPGLAIRVGTKENDLLRLELLGYLFHNIPYGPHRNALPNMYGSNS